MKNLDQQKKERNNQLLLRYAGLGTQLLAAIALAVYGGLKLDEWIKPGMTLLVWLLPLLMIAAIIYKIIKDTAPKK